jgi:hypothetical protein
MCPDGNTFSDGCQSDNWNNNPFAALYATLNPDYAAQTPMFEGIRSDILRSPFGWEPQYTDKPADMGMYSVDHGYATMGEASGGHGITIEILGFFVAPYTAHYSFMQWGTNYQDMWMSMSGEDPSQLEIVSQSRAGQTCRLASGNNPNTLLSCQIFNVNWEGNWWNHKARWNRMGRPVDQGFNFSGDNTEVIGPTVKTVHLQKGERRYFVKRNWLPEDQNVRRRRAATSTRRRYFEGTGVRIHNPDLSHLTATQRSKLQDRHCWPTNYLFTHTLNKDGGQFRIGMKETAGGAITWC